MRNSLVFLVVCGLLGAGCGKNQVTVEIKGGEGNKVRLDANDLQFSYNFLVDAGSFTFPGPESKIDLDSGTYKVNVVAGDYLMTQVVELESPPVSGAQNYTVTFDIPAGSNAEFERRGTILYASTRTAVRNWDLFTIKADGSALKQLTDTREFEQYPSWSPDGKKILFTRGDVMSNIDICVIDEDGSGLVRLTEHPERDQRAAWSPDGEKIAFVSQRDGDVAIWIMDADGGNKRKLVKGRYPSWSPDSRKIVFTSSAFHDNDEIYTIASDGGEPLRLTENKKYDWFPVFSPAGDRILFDSELFGGQELMLMKTDGSALTRISIAEKTFEQEPSWSPDGRGLAYAGKMGESEYDIYLVKATGFDLDEIENPSVLPINLTDNDDRDDMSPHWRPF
jgi:Tol biopolymer transport system component